MLVMCVTAIAPTRHAHAQVPAEQWAAEAARNEVKVILYDRSFLRYKTHMKDSKGDQLRDVIESKDGTVARVLQTNGQVLTGQEEGAEYARLQAMLESPDVFSKHVQKDRNGKKLAVDVIEQLPAAMLFSYTPGQPQRKDLGINSQAEVVLDFAPNPKWSPPTMTSEVLTGLRGRVWIDKKSHYLVRMEGEVFQSVSFGFGVLARVFPGGKIVLQQERVNDDRWIVDHFEEHVTIRAMMVKTLKEDADLQAFDFHVVPEMPYKIAIQQLLSHAATENDPGRGTSR